MWKVNNIFVILVYVFGENVILKMTFASQIVVVVLK
jgi:hypothetical protein